jgi:hypothetical protein
MYRSKGRFASVGRSGQRGNRGRGAWLAVVPVLAIALAACGDDTTALPLLPANGPRPEVLPIRRLTNAEYTASVTDLFPGIKLPDLTFVPDTKILGFSNLSSAQTSSLVRMEQYETAGQAIAAAVVANPATLTGCDAAVAGESACAEPYLRQLARRAYRRPLTTAEATALQQLFAADSGTVDYPTRLSLAIEGILLSPKFLFRPEVGTDGEVPAHGLRPLTGHELATRLSYLINGSIPDAPLMAAADSGALGTAAELRAQAKRLLALPASQARLVNFHELWLGIDSINALTKNTTEFPKFTPAISYLMGQETRKFLQSVLFDAQGTLADLFTSNVSFVDTNLAAFYGVAAPATDWAPVMLDPAKRRGLLTQGSLLATMAKEDRTDPVRRGKFVLERLLCRTVIPPPPQLVALFKPLDLSKTARDQFTEHRTSAACAGCHKSLDPLGLPFEHYDAVGAWRDDDRGMTIDATGSIDRQDGKGNVVETIPFDGVPELAEKLVTLPDAQTCYLSQWFRFAEGRLNGDADKPYLDWLAKKFQPDTKVVDMVVEMVQSDNFRYLRIAP